jgi:hypothetical protein
LEQSLKLLRPGVILKGCKNSRKRPLNRIRQRRRAEGKKGVHNHMAEDKDRVKEGEENRQNIIEKLNVKSSEAKTYKDPDEEIEEKCN